MAIKVSIAAARIALDAITDRCDLGTPPALLKIYAGSVPTDLSVAAGTLLSSHVMTNPAFPASGSVDDTPHALATASAIGNDSSANATGTAAYWRIETGTAGTEVLQGSVTATGGGGDLEFDSVSFIELTTIVVSSLTVTLPEHP